VAVMRTVNAGDLILQCADLLGLDRTNIAILDFLALRDYLDKRLQTAWEMGFWPDLIRTEKRYYRDLYSTTASYAAPTLTTASEIYYPQTTKYYQSMLAQSPGGTLPADANGVTNTTAWHDSKTAYSQNAYSATTTYNNGDEAYYPNTDRSYSVYNGPVMGVLPTDTTKWGVLTEFIRFIDYTQTGKTPLGMVLQVADASPRLTTKGNELNWFLTENGVEVTSPTNFAWVTFKIRTIRLFGDTFDSTKAYKGGVDQIYYNGLRQVPPTTTVANFYDIVSDTTAGDMPDSAAAKFSKTNVPLIFQRYLIYGAWADYLRGDGQDEKAGVAEERADTSLEYQQQILAGVQRQAPRALVRTR